MVRFWALIISEDYCTISLMKNFLSQSLQILPRSGPSLLELMLRLEARRSEGNLRVFFIHFLQLEMPQNEQWEFWSSLVLAQLAPHVLHPAGVLWNSWVPLGLHMKKIASFSSNTNSREPTKKWRLCSRMAPTRESLDERLDWVSILVVYRLCYPLNSTWDEA